MPNAIIDLNGAWASGGVVGPFISTSGTSIGLDMSAYNRPRGSVVILGESQVDIDFPDDKNYLATVTAAPPGGGIVGTLEFSNGTVWTKPTFWPISLIVLAGRWSYGGTPGPFITLRAINNVLFTIDMSTYGRPQATGGQIDFADIRVSFPDDKEPYLDGRLQSSPPSIQWSNGSVWLYVPPSLSASWQNAAGSTVLHVTGYNFAPDTAVTGHVTSPTQPTFQIPFTGNTNQVGTFTASLPVSCRFGQGLAISVFVNSDPARKTTTIGTTCPKNVQP